MFGVDWVGSVKCDNVQRSTTVDENGKENMCRVLARRDRSPLRYKIDESSTHLFLIYFSCIFLAVKIYFNVELWNIHQLCVLHVLIEKEIIPARKEEKKVVEEELLAIT